MSIFEKETAKANDMIAYAKKVEKRSPYRLDIQVVNNPGYLERIWMKMKSIF